MNCWLKTNPDGTPSVEGVTKPDRYHIDQFSELQPVIHPNVEYCGAMGLDMIQGDHEDAPGQLELNFAFDRAEETADRLTTYRQVCRQVGREFGLFPCFMPKPFMGVSANGCHHNISLWQGDVNMSCPKATIRACPRRPAFTPSAVCWPTCGPSPPCPPCRPSTRTGASPTPGSGAPVFADWGFQNHSTVLFG